MRAAKNAARPAQYDPTSKNRIALIRKIQIGRKQIAVDEDDYRHQIREVSGQESLKECSETQLVRIIDWLKSKGFKPVQAKGAARHPMAGKARALWISLHHLGVVQNPSEQALEAFAQRQLKCERFAWARQSDAFRLIEALKAMAVRNGWQQHDRVTGKPFEALGLQISLCSAIIIKLQEADVIGSVQKVSDAAQQLRLAAPDSGGPLTVADYERLAKKMGEVLRKQASIMGEAA